MAKDVNKTKVPEKLLDQILGKDKYPGGKNGRMVQKKGAIKKGRKDPGPRNPRGTPSGRSMEEQLTAGVGQLPEVSIQDALLAKMGMPTAPVDVVPPEVEPGTVRPASNTEVNAANPESGRGRALAKSRHAVPPDDEFNRSGGHGGPEYDAEMDDAAADLNMADDYMDPAKPNYAGTTEELTPVQQATATRLFIDKYGHEPGTDGELVEAEQMFMNGMHTGTTAPVERDATETDILNTILGMQRKR